MCILYCFVLLNSVLFFNLVSFDLNSVLNIILKIIIQFMYIVSNIFFVNLLHLLLVLLGCFLGVYFACSEM